MEESRRTSFPASAGQSLEIAGKHLRRGRRRPASAGYFQKTLLPYLIEGVARGREISNARHVNAPPGVPALEEIVADLRVLRERGLVRIRHSDLPALRYAAERAEAQAAA